MRLKHNPKAEAFLSNSSICFNGPTEALYDSILSFCKDMPLFIEIGCGKGQFIIENARRFSSTCFIGIEQYDSCLYSALKKCQDDCPPNLKFLCVRAETLENIFIAPIVDRIFLNFSDPWPKKRHHKRRLTSPVFLNIYHKIMKPGACIIQKTDNLNLFEYSIEQFEESEYFDIISKTRDLYSCPDMLTNNIPTEYEEKFHSLGYPIYKLITTHGRVD